MRLGDRAGDEEAEPRARLRARHVRPAELLEDQHLLVLGNAGAAVADRDPDGAVLRPHDHLDLVARRRVFDRIVDQVHEHLAQALAIAADRRDRPDHARAHLHLVLAYGSGRDGVFYQPLQVDVREAEGERPRFDARGVEHVADQAGEPVRLVRDQCEERLALVGVEHAPAAVKRSGRPDDGGHRAAKLVRDEGDEVRAQGREPAQLLDGLPLGLVGADVLDRRRDEATEERHELDLLVREGIRLLPRERDHADRPCSENQGSDQLAVEPERDEAAVLRVLVVGELAPDDDLAVEHAVEHRAVKRPLAPGGKHLGRAAACGGDRSRGVALDQHDRRALERHEPAYLADERAKRLLHLERGAERACAAVRRLEHVHTSAERIA